MRKRNTSIDRGRAILIQMVVLGHVITYANVGWSILPYTLLFALISSFHMPAFFLLSGSLIVDEKWLKESFGRFVSKNVQTIIVPYFFFETIAIFYKAFVLRNQSLLIGCKNLFLIRCNVGADWFLPALFIARTLYYLHLRINSKIVRSSLIVISLFCMWFIPKDGMWLSTISRGIAGFGFVGVGHFLRGWYLNLDKQNKLFMGKALLASIVVCICAVLNLKFFSNSFFDCVMENPVVFLIGGISGLYVVLSLAQVLEWEWLSYLGKNSLVVMGTHQLVLYTLHSGKDLIWVIGTLCLIAVIEMPLIYFTDNYCPRLVGKMEKRNGY